jgi:hypothetical protein
MAIRNLGPPEVIHYELSKEAVAQRQFHERWPAEPKREAQPPFERRGMFPDTQI